MPSPLPREGDKRGGLPKIATKDIAIRGVGVVSYGLRRDSLTDRD